MSWHRRKLAVLAAVGAVLSAVSAASPPDPPRVSVVVATAPIAAGATMTEADLTRRSVPEEVVPDGAATDVAVVAGRQASGPIAEGQLIAEAHLLTTRTPGRSDRVLVPIRVADPDVVGLLRVGDRVDVLSAAEEAPAARRVARQVLVVGLPSPTDTESPGGATGQLVLIETDERTASVLAQAAVSAQLSFLWR